jgi:hypothetical protein
MSLAWFENGRQCGRYQETAFCSVNPEQVDKSGAAFVKVVKDGRPGRYFAGEFSGLASLRGGYAGTEPVHTIVADRDAMPRDWFADERRAAAETFGRTASDDNALPAGVERRRCERRQRQVDVLLDTRITPRRRAQVDEEA